MVSSAAGASVQILICSFLQQVFNEEITAENLQQHAWYADAEVLEAKRERTEHRGL